MSVLNAIREVRDVGYRLAHQRIARRRTADQLGVTLLLDHPAISDRMYYVMSKDYESRDALLAHNVLTPDSQVLELGSSCGFMAIYCRKMIGVKNYAMVEANPALSTLIDQNFRLNDLDPSETPLIRAAAAGKDGEIAFTVHANSWSSSTIDRGGETIKVPARTLPSIIADLPFRPDALILDIEGSELLIPAQHYALFETLIIEMHPRLSADGAAKTQKLIDELLHLAFELKQRGGDSYVFTRPSPRS